MLQNNRKLLNIIKRHNDEISIERAPIGDNTGSTTIVTMLRMIMKCYFENNGILMGKLRKR
jgi:hypothetical protein